MSLYSYESCCIWFYYLCQFLYRNYHSITKKSRAISCHSLFPAWECKQTWLLLNFIPTFEFFNHVFRRKRRKNRALILTFLGNPIFFTISAIFRGKRGVKVGPKVQTLGWPLFYKVLNPSKMFQIFLFARVLLPLVRILTKSDHIWGSKGLKTSQKAISRMLCRYTKLWKNFNMAAANFMLIKLTTIMYLQEIFNLTKNWGATLRANETEIKFFGLISRDF